MVLFIFVVVSVVNCCVVLPSFFFPCYLLELGTAEEKQMHRFLLQQQLVYFILISLCFPNTNKEKLFLPFFLLCP